MTGSADLAEDIYTGGVLVLLREPGMFKPTRGAMRPFLLGIARNLVLKMLRRDKNRWGALDEGQFAVQPVQLTSGEIAHVVGNARLHRARENLRRMLAPLKGVIATPRPYGTTH